MPKLTKAQRDQFDRDVLASVQERNGLATYVLRNNLDWPGKTWHKCSIKTADVLRSCRRLEKRRLIEPASTSYAVMLAWQITAAGIAALEANHG